MQALLFPHFGLSAQHDTPLPATLRQEHLRPRKEQTHQLRFLQRSGRSVWKQQHHLVHVEIPHIMWYVIFLSGHRRKCCKHLNSQMQLVPVYAEAPACPADLVYEEQGLPFTPSCSHPNPRLLNHDLTSSCVCPTGDGRLNGWCHSLQFNLTSPFVSQCN